MIAPDPTVTPDEIAAFRRSIEADLADWIADYRRAGHDPAAMMRAALAAFPEATGSMFAVALIKANRARGGSHA